MSEKGAGKKTKGRRGKEAAGVAMPPLMADAVQAGFPSPAEHYIERELDLNDYFSPNREAVYYVRVTGESMTGANIFPGDVLCVDRSLDFFDGAIIVVSVDGEFTVKYLRRTGEEIWLEAANPRFPPIRFSPMQDIRFWGVVTGVARKIDYGRSRRVVPEPEVPPAQNVSLRKAGIRLNGTREKYKQKLDGQK